MATFIEGEQIFWGKQKMIKLIRFILRFKNYNLLVKLLVVFPILYDFEGILIIFFII